MQNSSNTNIIVASLAPSFFHPGINVLDVTGLRVAFSFGEQRYIHPTRQERIGSNIAIDDCEYVEYKAVAETNQFEQFKKQGLFVYVEYVAVCGVKHFNTLQ